MSKTSEQNNSDLLQVVNLKDEPKHSTVSEPDFEDVQYADDEIGPGKLVSLNFSLALDESPETIIDSNFDKNSVNFAIGDGNLLPGFEKVLFGLKAGDEKVFTIPSEQAFGIPNEDNIQRYPRYQFPADLVLEKGLMINFTDAAGNEQAGVVYDFSSSQVEIDFNHPLSGKDILFSVAIKIVSFVEK